MAEPLIETLSAWIKTQLTGAQDPDKTLTLSPGRPTLIDWDVASYSNMDVVIEEDSTTTTNKSTGFRYETGAWKIYGIIRALPANTALGTVANRMAETIRTTLLAGNSNGKACGGLAIHIDCPKTEHLRAVGCEVVVVTCDIDYATNYTNTFS